MNDSVVALSVLKSKLRLYCLRLTDKILILGNGGVKNTRTDEEDDTLQGYVMDLQKFERLLKQEVQNVTLRSLRGKSKPIKLSNYENRQTFFTRIVQ